MSGNEIPLGHKYRYLLFATAISTRCRKVNRYSVDKNQPSLSAITEIELLCWKTDNEKDIQLMRDFIQDSWIIELDQPVKNETVDLRKKNGMKLPDAIIAATARVYNLTLITRNTKDFKRVVDLQLLNPFDL